nr:AAA family ATPase [Hyphomicrobium methylovorum]
MSGCSGGGKSSILAELRRRGYAVVEEPGRRIIQSEMASGSQALPWVDIAAFARRAIETSLADRVAAAASAGWVFFDRGLIDAAVALEHATGEPAIERYGRPHRYHHTVFFTPPWPEIYASDPERRHGLDDALGEYRRLEHAYPALGYRLAVLPKVGVAARADAVLAALEVNAA